MARMDNDASHRLIEAMGLMAQDDGHPRIAGQMMGYLVIAGEPRSLTQMADALGVSKGSVSTNARLLESRGMLRRAGRMGSRQDAWELVAHPDGQMIATLAARFRRNAETLHDLAGDFPEDGSGARGRVEDFADFYRLSADFMDEWRERVINGTAATRGTPED